METPTLVVIILAGVVSAVALLATVGAVARELRTVRDRLEAVGTRVQGLSGRVTTDLDRARSRLEELNRGVRREAEPDDEG